VAAFAHGRGNVIYTAFHNEAQLSEREKILLRYLVLRPVLAKAAGAAAQVAKAAQCTPGREILATINRGQRSDPYVYTTTGAERLLYVLSWTGAGQLRMVVTDPAGKVRHDGRSASPMQFETPGTPGKWTCTIEAISVPHDNFPYVLTLATRRQSAGEAPPPAPAGSQAPKLQAGAASSSMLWPCYIVMDCSRWASDAGPAIGQGLSAFIRGLARLPSTNLIPALSLVESRAGTVAVPTPRKISELAPVNLSCKGEPSLKPALTALLASLAAVNAQHRGKPFIVVLLAANPNDDFQTAAQQLKQLAAMGRANVAAIGLGRQVSDSTLCALATIPLRVLDPTIPNCVTCFEWLVQVANSVVSALSQASGQAVTLPPLPAGVQWLR
jgi:uncharacterized protein YegL